MVTPEPDTPSRLELVPWIAVAAALGLGLVRFGNVFPDEGWYLQGGRLVAQGLTPYRDFAFFQAPLGPYLFSLANGSFVGGRLLCLSFGLGAIALALDMARHRGRAAMVWTALMLVPATYTLRWYAVTRNIAPAAFLLMLALWLHDRLRGRLAWLCLLPMALASTIRLSATGGLAALVIRAWLKKTDRSQAPGPPGRLVVVVGLLLLALWGPFATLGPDRLVFNNLLYHTGLHGGASPLDQLRSKVQGIVRLADHHHLAAFLLLVLVVQAVRHRSGGWSTGDPGVGACATTVLAVTALHLVPGRLHPEYHELVLPPLAVALGVAVSRIELGRLSRAVALVLALTGLLGARTQLYAVTGWNPAHVSQIGQTIARLCGPTDAVLTFVPDFALAADRPLWPGFEMASVSLAHPSLPAPSRRRFHMVDLSEIATILASGGPRVVVWRDLADADQRRVALYTGAERAGVQRALGASYRLVESRAGWDIYSRKGPE
ncbi:MAG: hypothetical protein HY815_33820 [Candidatus Riflebacteria bacterium]|nr:hypothetical protein [Candidatus Riflebacteria bacterium]